MKNLLLAFLIILLYSNLSAQDSTNTNGKAIVYIYRGGQFGGSLSNYSIFINDKKICKLSNGKFLKVLVDPGKIDVSAKLGGVSVLKKETNIELEVEAGGVYYVSCTIKQSITRTRLEMTEVTKNSGVKDLAKLTEDNCQGKIEKEE